MASVREVHAFDDQTRADHPKATFVHSIKAEKAWAERMAVLRDSR